MSDVYRETRKHQGRYLETRTPQRYLSLCSCSVPHRDSYERLHRQVNTSVQQNQLIPMFSKYTDECLVLVAMKEKDETGVVDCSVYVIYMHESSYTSGFNSGALGIHQLVQFIQIVRLLHLSHLLQTSLIFASFLSNRGTSICCIFWLIALYRDTMVSNLAAVVRKRLSSILRRRRRAGSGSLTRNGGSDK